MSVIGIDLGTIGGTIASIQKGKVVTLRTEVSERTTPALVNYAKSGERVMGDPAAMTLTSNGKTTANNMKYLLGLSFTDVEAVKVQQQYTINELVEGPGRHVAYNLNGNVVTSIQATASFLVKLADVAKQALESGIVGAMVLSVPDFYGETRVGFLRNAMEVAQLKLIDVIYEHKAIAMDYGMYRRRHFDTVKPQTTCFVDMGHGKTSIFVGQFTQHYGKIIAHVCDKNLGGRNIDAHIMDHMNNKFMSETKIDALQNFKAKIKLEAAATKVKKTLSANKVASFNMEYLVDGRDLSGSLSADELEGICGHIKETLQGLFKRLFQDLSEDVTIDTVEMVGDGGRLPWVGKLIEQQVGKAPQRTLSADETIARGCALYGAILSPTVVVKGYPLFDAHNKVPRALRNPPPPPPVEPKKDSKLKGGFFSAPKKDESAKTDETPTSPEGKANDGEQEETTGVGEDSTPEVEEEPEAAPEPEAELEAEPESEDEPVVPLVIEDPPNSVGEVFSPGTIRGYIEQEKEQKKRDLAAKKREVAINDFESFAYLCGNRSKEEWKDKLSSDAKKEILAAVEQAQDYLYDHLDEDYKVYRQKQEELKELVGQFVDDFKPVKRVPETEATPTTEKKSKADKAPESNGQNEPPLVEGNVVEDVLTE